MENKDVKSVLDEYMPLIIPSIQVELDYDKGLEINYSNFEWCRTIDHEEESGYKQRFADGDKLELIGYDGVLDADIDDFLRKEEGIRLPDVSLAFGSKTLIFSKEAWSVLEFSKKTGTTQGDADLVDPFGYINEGYKFVSFYNPLPIERAEKRYSKIDEKERPFIYIELKKNREIILIHKSAAENLSKLGIKCFLKEIPEKYSDFRKYLKDELYYGNHEYTFDSIEDWQNNIFTYSNF